jgi:outer membrane protein W
MFFVICIQASAAKKHGSITSISYGGYQTTDGEDTLNGSKLAVSFTSYFAEQWSYFIRLSKGNATGTRSENSNTYELKADTTTLTGGIRWSYDFDINSDNQDELSPYIGTGLSVQKYEYDFDYQGSEVGKTSGTGYGPFVNLGLKIAISSNIVIVPGYHYERIAIKTEEGLDRSFSSSGLSLAFVARF